MIRNLASLAVSAVIGLAIPPASAQFVKGNLAVKAGPGSSRVETPPVPPSAGKVCAASAKCHAGAWHMVETTGGLVECTEPYARATSCRGSTYGTQKLPRLWIVKAASGWRWCQYPDLGSICRDMFARPPANLPIDAVQ
jgi:hypothetical protein